MVQIQEIENTDKVIEVFIFKNTFDSLKYYSGGIIGMFVIFVLTFLVVYFLGISSGWLILGFVLGVVFQFIYALGLIVSFNNGVLSFDEDALNIRLGENTKFIPYDAINVILLKVERSLEENSTFTLQLNMKFDKKIKIGLSTFKKDNKPLDNLRFLLDGIALKTDYILIDKSKFFDFDRLN